MRIAGLPSAPGNPFVYTNGTTAIVYWTAANPNGAPIQHYTVTQQPGGAYQTVGGNSFQVTFTALTPGVMYNYYITATNAVGTGPAAVAVDSPSPPPPPGGGGGGGSPGSATTPAGRPSQLDAEAPDPAAVSTDTAGDQQLYATGTLNNQANLFTQSWVPGSSTAGPSSDALPESNRPSYIQHLGEFAPSVAQFNGGYVLWFRV